MCRNRFTRINWICTIIHPSIRTPAIMNRICIGLSHPHVLCGTNFFFSWFSSEWTSLLEKQNSLYTYMPHSIGTNAKSDYVSVSPRRNASSARTSVTYCNASSIGIKCKRPLSVGSLIQPSMGMALSGWMSVTISFWSVGVAYPRGRYSSSDCCPGSSPCSDRAPRSSGL